MSDDATGEKSGLKAHALNRRSILLGGTTLAAASTLGTAASIQLAQAQQPTASGRPPNILVIMGDDVGWFNIGAYHQGIMSGKTPNLDKLAAEGMRFTDYYAEASCTAGRANFITGQIPPRTGMTTVGQAGADVGIPDQAVTTATVLKSLGYATGQFGKNHLGGLNKYLPTVHGFDEFFGYLYHLDAMSDPYWFDYPQDWIDKYGPRNLVHCFATDTDDATVMPRWGKVGKQRIVDEGPLAPFPNMSADHQGWQKGRAAKYDMETFDDVLVEHSKGFMDKAKQAGKPFFIWHNTTRRPLFEIMLYCNGRAAPCSRAAARDETADINVAVELGVPNHRIAGRVAGIVDNGFGRHHHPLTVDRHPVFAFAHVVVGAMTVGDVATRNPGMGLHALEPSADFGGHVAELPVVAGQRRGREEKGRNGNSPAH